MTALIKLVSWVLGAQMLLGIMQGQVLAVCTAWAGFAVLAFLRD